MSEQSLAARVEEALDLLPCTASLLARGALFETLAADWQRLRERERVLTEALKFYADARNYEKMSMVLNPSTVTCDCGQRARAALAPEPK